MKQDDWADTCSARFVRQLDRLLDGDLRPRQQRQLEQHLQTCPHCQERLRELKAVRALLKRSPPVAPPRSFTLCERDVATYRRVLWYPALRSATAVLAVLVVALFVVGLVQPVMGGPQAATARAIGVKPTPPCAPSPQSVAVAPAITQRVPPTVGIQAQPTTPPAPPTECVGAVSQTAYPAPQQTPWIHATVPKTEPCPTGQPTSFWNTPLWQALRFGSLLVLALFIGLTWLAYRRERAFFS